MSIELKLGIQGGAYKEGTLVLHDTSFPHKRSSMCKEIIDLNRLGTISFVFRNYFKNKSRNILFDCFHFLF